VSKVRKQIIREKSKIYKNSQNTLKIKKSSNYRKKRLSHENRLKSALFTANNVILRFFFAQHQHFSKIHTTDKTFFLTKTKKYVFYDIE
jgi:hypothetical protein